MSRVNANVLSMAESRRAVADDVPYAHLVRAATRGDGSAFDSLLRQHEEELRSFLSRRVESDEVDDLLQDIWVAAWLSIGAYAGRSRFKTWLYSIAMFKVKDLYRRRTRDQAWLSESDAQTPAVSTDPSHAEVQKHWVRAALEHLTSDQRQLLELYYFADFTMAEIAKILGKGLNTVKYQFYRAHRDIADQMKQTGALDASDTAPYAGGR
jgi:RNA polymerase sigma-70 factor (ECF subfamily)